MKVIDGLYYSTEHEWMKVDGDTAKVGITDFAQDSLGDIAYIEMPEEGEEFEKDSAFGVVESVKAASDLYLPVTGTITAINDEVEEDPALLNSDSYENWIIEIELADIDELTELMDAKEYEKYTTK